MTNRQTNLNRFLFLPVPPRPPVIVNESGVGIIKLFSKLDRLSPTDFSPALTYGANVIKLFLSVI